MILCLYSTVAPTAGNNATLTFSVGDDLVLMAVFSEFNLELDSIVWTQNSSISLMDGVTISNTALSPSSASSTLTRPGITGVSYGGTYTATASNRAGSSSTTFTVHIIIMLVQFQLRLVGLSDCLQWRVSYNTVFIAISKMSLFQPRRYNQMKRRKQ